MSQAEGELTEGNVPVKAQTAEYTIWEHPHSKEEGQRLKWIGSFEDWKEKSQKVKTEPEQVPRAVSAEE